MDAFGKTIFSGTSKTLLHRVQARELTFDDFMRECAYWAIREGFDELKPKQMPTPPTTQAFSEFESLLPDRRAKVDPDFFRKNEEILIYYQQVFFVYQRNKANLEWLETINKYLPEDEILRNKVTDRILEFKAFFDDNPVYIEKLKSSFQATEIKPKPNTYYSTGEMLKQ